MKVAVHWFRRDLRAYDNRALYEAGNSGLPVLGLFIFDKSILDELEPTDARVSFIHERLQALNYEIGGGLYIVHDTVQAAWKTICADFEVEEVFVNEDYEPYAIQRDNNVEAFLSKQGIKLHSFKDQVVFAKDEVMKDDGSPYTVFTPYKKKYLSLLTKSHLLEYKPEVEWHRVQKPIPTLKQLGFKSSNQKVVNPVWDSIEGYEQFRDFPAKQATTSLGPHLRFGTVSVRQLFRKFRSVNETFISELIWREFFMQILYHFPKVISRSFKPQYDQIEWRNDENDFGLWCEGQTGYPIVDAGMRELNATGYMHNRVRMIVASFLCKHLLIHWSWGEAYFASKLLDYELASNNGNWQWAAGTGCDAAPYFRVFNPHRQTEKFDPKRQYIKKWVPEYDTPAYPKEIIEHSLARKRALEAYKAGLEK